ncbi:MAG: DUF6732 family protein [Pseudomonadota bacterium]
MRYLICLLIVTGPAFAHPGHLAEVAGHGHWLGAAAIGAAIAIGLYAGFKGRKAKAEEVSDEDVAEESPESQEA